MGEVARRHGLSVAAVSKKAKKESWIQDVSATVNRIVEAKVNGVVNTVDPVKKAEAINAAADAKLKILEIHKSQWEKHRRHVEMAVEAADFEAAKLAKITAETLKIVQDGERQAWGIRKDDVPTNTADPVKELFREIADAQRGKRLPEYTPPTDSATDGSTTDKT